MFRWIKNLFKKKCGHPFTHRFCFDDFCVENSYMYYGGSYDFYITYWECQKCGRKLREGCVYSGDVKDTDGRDFRALGPISLKKVIKAVELWEEKTKQN